MCSQGLFGEELLRTLPATNLISRIRTFKLMINMHDDKFVVPSASNHPKTPSSASPEC